MKVLYQSIFQTETVNCPHLRARRVRGGTGHHLLLDCLYYLHCKSGLETSEVIQIGDGLLFCLCDFITLLHAGLSQVTVQVN